MGIQLEAGWSKHNANRMDVSKLKVADLKKELKARGLNTSGTKNELIERLQESSQDESADVLDNDDLLDEDAVLADDTEEAILAEDDNVLLTPTTILPPAPENPLKTPAVAATTTSTKKVVLNRKPISVAPIPAVKDEAVPVTEESKASSNPEKVEEKKVVKLGTLSTEERAKLRAEKFGVPISDSVKKMVRAQRFGLASKPENTDSKEVLDEKLLKRQARFGVVTDTEVDIKKQKRAERFGLAPTAAATAANDELKRKRAERFGLV